MTASNSVGFSWTEEKSSIFLDIMTHLVISKKLDPLADGTIEMVLSKLVEFKDLTLFRGITMQDLKEHLLERRKIYMRVCELANHPNIKDSYKVLVRYGCGQRCMRCTLR